MGDVSEPPGPGGPANPGWHADPWGESAWRWWDGWQWTGWLSPPPSAPNHLVNQVAQAVAHPPRPDIPAAPEAPQRERLPGWGSPGTAWPAPEQPQPGYQQFPGQPGYPPYANYPQFAMRPGDRRPAAPPAEPVPASQRRRVVAELVVVLGVFPLPYVLSALIALFTALLGGGAGNRLPVIIKGHTAASFPFEMIEVMLPLVAAGLVAYLLSVPGPIGGGWTGKKKGEAPAGEGGLRAIGLDFRSWRGDLAMVIGIFVLCNAIPIGGGGILLHAIGVRGISPGTGGVPKYYTLIDVASGIVAGIVEEIVVLGFVIRRLEQLKLKQWQVVVIAVAVRGSYHLYYGWDVLPILAWATVTVLVYMRYRRLLPFIIVHMLWDSSAFILGALSTRDAGAFLLIEMGVLMTSTFVMWLVWRRQIPQPRLPHPPAPGVSGYPGYGPPG